MRITHLFKETSKQTTYMNYYYNHAYGDIFSRYSSPSYNKISAWSRIVNDYSNADITILDSEKHQIPCKIVLIQGKKHYLHYNHDISIAGASSHFFSTIASFTDTETQEIYLIKETQCNTYACKLLVGGTNNE